MICADVLEDGSFCIGDGGGPLVTENKIVSKQYSLEKKSIQGILFNMNKILHYYYLTYEKNCIHFKL